MCFGRYVRETATRPSISAFSSPTSTTMYNTAISHPKLRAIHKYPSLPESELRKIMGDTKYSMSGADAMILVRPRNSQLLTPVIVKEEEHSINPYLEDEDTLESTA
jgi:hypothetical protein